MKYAIIKTGEKQFRVKEGHIIQTELIPGKIGDISKFDNVLLLVDGEKRKIGQPYIKNCLVSAKILDQTKGDKIRVATYRAKSRYRKVKGHRQKISKILIVKFEVNEKSPNKRTRATKKKG